MLKAIGLDIGTTTLSAVVTDCETGKILKSVTVPNDSADNDKLQNPERIISVITGIRDDLVENFGPVACIGITGQMHGILYIDKNGKAVSKLYTWQDTSGNKPYRNGTYASELSCLTGYNMASGFGITTHFVNMLTGSIPENAVSFCTIHDYLVMCLTGRKTPLMHISDAASLGCFDIKNNYFDINAVKNAGIDISFLPVVTAETAIAGYDKNNIPVSVAIGDNQASVLGSLKGEDSVLVNIGTGSQVSVITDRITYPEEGEIRPLTKNRYIIVGAPLCGGRSFALLHDFFAQWTKYTGGNENDVYKIMDSLAEKEPDNHPIEADTRFCGTRKNPSLKGSISGITENNFTPENLIRGFLYGMAEELYSLYKGFDITAAVRMTASGNAVRKSVVLQKYLSELFSIPLYIPSHKEEASFGAVVFAAAAAGIYASTSEAAEKMIHYGD